MSDLDRQKVREALELFDYSAGTEGTHVGDARDRRLDMLMQYFINEFPASARDLRVSTSLFSLRFKISYRRVRGAVHRLKNSFRDLTNYPP
jgi:hypothetical protein